MLSGRTVQIGDLPQLPLGRMVLEESLRLYPPARVPHGLFLEGTARTRLFLARFNP